MKNIFILITATLILPESSESMTTNEEDPVAYNNLANDPNNAAVISNLKSLLY
jgi:hypothetical protein